MQPGRVCNSIDCQTQHALAEIARRKATETRQKAKTDRADTARRKEALKTNAQRAKDAQKVINEYVRLRDKDQGCISCDKPATWQGQWHASHFRSVGAAPSLRFNLWNIHKSCSVCNNYLSGNIAEYEPRLRAKIGDEKVDWLKSQNGIKKYTNEYISKIIRVFKKKLRRLKSKVLLEADS